MKSLPLAPSPREPLKWSFLSVNAKYLVLGYFLIFLQVSAQTSTYPTLDSLKTALMSLPGNPDPAGREEVFRGLESFMLVEPYFDIPANIQYYQDMCEHALDEIEAETGYTKGVKVWKFYSSAYILKSGNTIFSFDMHEGKFDFVLTQQQIDRVADLIDVAFYSHIHEDHISYPIIKALFKAGKTVVVPDEVIHLTKYSDIAGRLSSLTPIDGTVYNFKDLRVEACDTTQGFRNKNRIPVENNIYLVKTVENCVVMHKGDANDGDEAWNYFSNYKERGGTVDLYLGGYSPFGTKDTDYTGCAAKIHEAFDDFVLPGHIYEWEHLANHPRDGLLTYDRVMDFDGYRIDAGRGMVLSWGEHYHYLPEHKPSAVD